VLVDEETEIFLECKGDLHTIEDSKTFSEAELLENVRGAVRRRNFFISGSMGTGKLSSWWMGLMKFTLNITS